MVLSQYFSMEDDTIYGLATPPGVGAVAIIRLSGRHALAIARAMMLGDLPKQGEVALRWLHDAAGRRLDQALILRFDAPRSFTAEDVVEFQCHGGRAVVAAVLTTLSHSSTARLAKPGEFTWRAFLNGRLDLTEVEALGDLITAETERQRQHAIGGVSGALRERVKAWRSALTDALALLEATIDWADEEVPEAVDGPVRDLLAPILDETRKMLVGSKAAERLRGGYEVALLGAVNAGKSTLLNALAGREVAITSREAGTTRDVIEVTLDIDGLPVTIIDTAGIRRASSEIERIGVQRAITRAEEADLRVFVAAPDAPMPCEAKRFYRAGDLQIWNKVDLQEPKHQSFPVSAKTGSGIEELIKAVSVELSKRAAGAGIIGHMRQLRLLETLSKALQNALRHVEDGIGELAAEELRAGLTSIEELAGRTVVDDVLRQVFSRFCLGK